MRLTRGKMVRSHELSRKERKWGKEKSGRNYLVKGTKYGYVHETLFILINNRYTIYKQVSQLAKVPIQPSLVLSPTYIQVKWKEKIEKEKAYSSRDLKVILIWIMQQIARYNNFFIIFFHNNWVISFYS